MPGLVLGEDILLFKNKNFEVLVVLADAEGGGQSENPTSDYADVGFHTINKNVSTVRITPLTHGGVRIRTDLPTTICGNDLTIVGYNY